MFKYIYIIYFHKCIQINNVFYLMLLISLNGLGPSNSLTPPLFIEVPVNERSCICVLWAYNLICSTGFSKCSDSVVFFGFHFVDQDTIKTKDNYKQR